MRMRHSRQHKERILKTIAWSVLVAAVAVVGFAVHETIPSNAPRSADTVPVPVIAPEEQPGYGVYFSDKLKLGFLFPKEQDPLKANSDITGALDSVKTRDFIINIYHAPEFTYQPWYSGQPMCAYDGALHSFKGSLEDSACELAPTEFAGGTFFTQTFSKNNVTKHVFLTSVLNRKYFIEFASLYDENCNVPVSPQNVCLARSEQKRSKLEMFVRNTAVKNPELFKP